MQDHVSGRWTCTKIEGQYPEPLSYLVETPKGKTLRRNRNQLCDDTPQKRVIHSEPHLQAQYPQWMRLCRHVRLHSSLTTATAAMDVT